MGQKFLVIGASGTVGSQIVSLLKASGASVRTTTGKKSGTSADQVYVNLETGEGIQNAFEGIDRAFLLSPSGFAAQDQILIPLIQQAQARKLKKVVLMSAMGADASDQAPLRKAELALEKSGLNYNIIRPNWFMQNFATFWIGGIQQFGKVLLPAGDAKTSFIDARDIAAVAARLLVKDDFNNQAFNLTGPEAIDHDQVASVIAEVSGKKVVYQETKPEELKSALLAAGLHEDYSSFLVEIMGYLKAGYNAGLTGEVKKITGKDPISFQQFAKDYKASW